MSDNSKIQWTDATWNFLAGCTKKSAGCKNCYAIRTANRLSRNPSPKVSRKYEGTVTADGKNWTGRINFDEASLMLPASWKEPKRIFVNSVSDLFHPNVSDTTILRAFSFMGWCNHHTYQILTKHPDRMRTVMAWVGRKFRAEDEDWPLPNVWLGTSVEDQKAADERITDLLHTEAAVRFLSIEPLLGAVDLLKAFPALGCSQDEPTLADIHWVIVGGESGPDARECDLEDVRRVVGQCQDAGVAVFVKQLGAWPYQHWPDSEYGLRPLRVKQGKRKSYPFLNLKDGHGGDLTEWPEELRVREFPAPARG